MSRYFCKKSFYFAFLAGMLACKKPGPASEHGRTTSPNDDSEATAIARIQNDARLTENQKALLIAHVPEEIAGKRQEEKDRRELVAPPPPNWKPEDARRKIQVTLIPEKRIFHKGESFRYRLEIMNIGREPIILLEEPGSFIKSGQQQPFGCFDFYMTEPEGRDHWLRPPFPAPGASNQLREYHLAEGLTEQEKKAAFDKFRIEKHAESQLLIHLRTGETLFSRGDSPQDRFRALPGFHFKAPGIYRIRLTYKDIPSKPPSEAHIKKMLEEGVSREKQMAWHAEAVKNALGRVESNPVVLQCTP